MVWLLVSIRKIFNAIIEVTKGTHHANLFQGSVDEPEEGLDEVNEEGAGRDVFGSKVGEVGNVGSVHDRPIKSIGRKKNLSVKSHGMITRLSKATDFGNENIVPEEMKASWNLKEEIAKVIKAGRVLGLNFNGREKDMVEEILFGSNPVLANSTLTVISDSKIAVQWISGCTPGNNSHDQIIGVICSWLGCFKRAVVEFRPRSTDSFADTLAKKGLNPGVDDEWWSVS
ncbi:hypothetical protein LWI29_004712 [Acer saccharum]|uniref:RNase H type-1 domain-containing protein n=1 Tax=Acer saccharum TaxID=4024 RepID=A0AA39SKV3_ACESA|nr:hypothetical protein LWI29_004712 [Acer saccharum]